MSAPLDMGIANTERHTVVAGLGRLLADSERLYAKTRTYHWKVTGPRFGPLHELFEAQYRELVEAIDAVAERMRALGAFAPGDVAREEAPTRVPFGQESVPDAEAMLGNLVRAHEAVLRTARELLPVAEEVGDAHRRSRHRPAGRAREDRLDAAGAAEPRRRTGDGGRQLREPAPTVTPGRPCGVAAEAGSHSGRGTALVGARFSGDDSQNTP